MIAFIRRQPTVASNPNPYGQPFWCLASFLYVVKHGRIVFPASLGEDMENHKGVDDFVGLIEKAALKGRKLKLKEHLQEYVPGKVLFLDDFSDRSMSGWTLLKGARPGVPKEDGAYGLWGEIWMAEGVAWKNDYFEQAGKIGRLSRGWAGHLTGERNGTHIQIGVYNGRFRLRSTFLHQHVTAVAGDPNWTDYQVDADMYDYRDKRIDKPTLLAEDDYGMFGIFGRMTVPNLPNTKGEHTEIGVEFGNYANFPVTWGPVDTPTIQIRLKTADVRSGRDEATSERKTKILDYRSCEFSKRKAVHVTAKFMGRRVEGWIDGKKYVEGIIPESNWPQFQHGRIGLWVFTTFAEFDNVKVTELVKAR